MKPLQIRPFNDQRTSSRDYVQPAPDRTLVKVRITRDCMTSTTLGGQVKRVEAGSFIEMERCCAETLRWCGKADLL